MWNLITAPKSTVKLEHGWLLIQVTKCCTSWGRRASLAPPPTNTAFRINTKATVDYNTVLGGDGGRSFASLPPTSPNIGIRYIGDWRAMDGRRKEELRSLPSSFHHAPSRPMYLFYLGPKQLWGGEEPKASFSTPKLLHVQVIHVKEESLLGVGEPKASSAPQQKILPYRV